MWLRQAATADVRKTSAGHFFAITNQTMSTATSYGTILVHYNIKYSTPTSKDLSYASQWAQSNQTIASGGSGLNLSTANRLQPYSNTVVSMDSDSMVMAKAFPVLSTSQVLVLNHAFTTPAPTFVQASVVIFGTMSGLPSNIFLYALGGVIQAENIGYVVDAVSLSATAFHATYTFFIPPGSPPDSAQLCFEATASVTGPFAWILWTLQSQLFQNDFAPEPLSHTFKQRMKWCREHQISDEKQITDHEVDGDTVSVASVSFQRTRLQDLVFDEKQDRFIPKKSSSMK
jgi:hypothetical protein